ncbi:MAG: glycosyltransferase, partial [Solirubrobacterales bacterium]
MSREEKRIAVLAPPPLAGSGGHRTVYRNLNALAEAGYPVTVFVEARRFRPGRAARKQTRSIFGVADQIELVSGWPERIDGEEMVMATTWQSALHLGEVETPGIKAHFVQDYECLFYPEDDGRHALARRVHDLGFPSVTIGSWLVEVLSREHGITAWPTPFSADLELYGADPTVPVSRRRMVVANYQPEKPRRCPELMEKALQLVLDTDPSVEVVTFGGSRAPRLNGNHRHLGLVEPEDLAALYREAGVGLSMSATNPSRVPFEMMAAGLPVVELGGDNTILDLPEQGCLLAHPDPAAVAVALSRVLVDGQESA